MSRLTGEIPTIGTRVNEIHCAIAHRPPHVNFAAPPDVPSRPDEPVHDPNPLTSEDDANDTDRDERAQSEATAQTVPNRRYPLFPNASPPPAGTTWTTRTFPAQKFPPRNPYHTPPRDHVQESRRVTSKDEDSSQGDPLLGERINSPRNVDRRRLAADSRCSPFDIGGLANVKYHGGVDGCFTLTVAYIRSCGYTEVNTAKVITGYSEIIHVHESLMTNWMGKFTAGPQIAHILEKGLPSLPRLSSPMTVEAAVDWYDLIQKTLLIYLIPITPLDCVMLKMGYEALCIPGIGLSCYTAVARVLMELLPRLLPKNDMEITSIINMVRMESNNGYDILWRTLELTVPGFDPTNPVKIPIWHDYGIFDFAHAFLLYYRLQAKKGVWYDDRTRSTTFLQSVDDPAYVDMITTLLMCINNYYTPNNNEYLPANLCVMGLAQQLHKTAKNRARSILP
jgi:hypothetical protein